LKNKERKIDKGASFLAGMGMGNTTAVLALISERAPLRRRKNAQGEAEQQRPGHFLGYFTK
jgi:hypothetical protein